MHKNELLSLCYMIARIGYVRKNTKLWVKRLNCTSPTVNEIQVMKLSIMKLKKKNAGRYILERGMGRGVLC